MKELKESNFNKLMLFPIRDTDIRLGFQLSQVPILKFQFGEVKNDLGGNTLWGVKLKTSGVIFIEHKDEIRDRFNEEDCLFISETVQRMFDQLVNCIDTKNIDIMDLYQHNK